jgi:hypothetical protein
MSAVKRVVFVSDRMSYTTLIWRWCYIIVLDVHAPTENKIDDMKGSFYNKLERVTEKFPKYHKKNLLGDFDAKVSMEGIFKPEIGNETLHELIMITELG